MTTLAFLFWRLLSEGCLTWVSEAGHPTAVRCVYETWSAAWMAVSW
jgi:hypothetical protein